MTETTPDDKARMVVGRVDAIIEAMERANARDAGHARVDKICASYCAALDFAAATLVGLTGSAGGDDAADVGLVEQLRLAAARAMNEKLREVHALLN